MPKLKLKHHHPVACQICKKTFKNKRACTQHLHMNNFYFYVQQQQNTTSTSRSNNHHSTCPIAPSFFGIHFSTNPSTSNTEKTQQQNINTMIHPAILTVLIPIQECTIQQLKKTAVCTAL